MEKATPKIKTNVGGNQVLNVTRRDISEFIVGMLGFFMGRVIIFGDVNPLGIAYMSTFFLEGNNFYIAAFFTLVGLMTKLSFFDSLKYIICIVTMCLLNFIFTKKAKGKIYIYQSVGAGIILALSGIVTAVISGGYIYFILLALLDGVLTFSIAFLIKKGMLIINGRYKNRVLTNEDLISLAIIAGGIVAGSSDIYISNISLRYYFCSVIVMLMSYKGGLTMGTTSGLLLGFLLKLSGYEDANFIVILSIAGLLAGSMKELARQFIAAGFALGCTLVSFYLQPKLINSEFLLSILFAGITFILIPEKVMSNVSVVFNPTLDNTDSYIEKMKELTTYKLYGFARAFKRLSKTFSGISEKRTSLTQKDITNLIDDAAAKTCIDCEKMNLCWEENFYNTYQNVFSMLNACEKKAVIEDEDITEELKNTCVNVSGFADNINRVFELYKTNLVWHNRIVESRELVSEQLLGVSKVIDGLASELDIEVNFKEDIENTILDELNKNKIEIDKVIVLENKLGKYEISISHKPCYNKNFCVKGILPILNKATGRKMKREDDTCIVIKEKNNSICKLNFIEEQQFCLTTAVSRATKDGGKESGDSYSYMELKNGQCILALSDGMGSGKRAREESAAAVDLLEEFVETGFDKDTAVKMINSVLLLKSNEESFSTLDICSVDLYTGEAEFMKIGASSTFIIRKNEVGVVRSWSLPVGILNDIDLDITKKQLKDGDIIVMVTDGILDLENNDEDKEGWIVDTLRNKKFNNPQDVADVLIEEAKEKSKGVIGDDMTVLAARFWERI